MLLTKECNMTAQLEWYEDGRLRSHKICRIFHQLPNGRVNEVKDPIGRFILTDSAIGTTLWSVYPPDTKSTGSWKVRRFGAWMRPSDRAGAFVLAILVVAAMGVALCNQLRSLFH